MDVVRYVQVNSFARCVQTLDKTVLSTSLSNNFRTAVLIHLVLPELFNVTRIL